jgi:ribonuclease Z
MPKDPTAAREMKAQRIRKAKDNAKLLSTPSGTASIHVLGNGAPGNPRSLLVSTDHQKYMFNCGEGTQRLSIDCGQKISKLSQVFLTRTCWTNMGGLPGLSMTLQAIGVPGLTIHAPKPISNFYLMTKYFSVTAELEVKERLPKDVMYTDPNLTVTYVPLKSKTDDSELVLNYIVSLCNLPGKLNIEKCFRLKIPKGPALGELKNGKDYVFPDGRVVKSSEVCDPEEPGPVFLVIDCPSEEYIDSLINSESFNRHISTKESLIPSHIFHFSPAEVLQDKRYQEWIHKFPETTFHFGINESNDNAGYHAAFVLQSQLRLLNEEVFPKLYVDDKKRSQERSFVPTKTNQKMLLRPYQILRYDCDEVPVYDEEAAVKSLLESEGVPEAIKEYKDSMKQTESESSESNNTTGDSSHAFDSPDVFPTINFLGTASAQPGKDRNTSCILINIDSDTSIIFDCGEGSYGQLYRFCGPDKIAEELEKLKCIFVTHLHADHHLGLITLLQERSKCTDLPITLILPQAVHNWLLAYDAMYEPIKDLFVCKQSENFMSRTPFDRQLLSLLKLSHLQTVRVKHCRDSFGIAITTQKDSFKIVYSGDAMPTPFLSVVGKDCDVLIHEATMDDELLDEAIIKRHSTTSQAIEMGNSMNAKYTILTHFSQRYAKIPMIDEATFQKNQVGCAFDNMKIRKCDLPRIMSLNQPLRIMYNEKQEEMMQRHQRRQLKLQVAKGFLQKQQQTSEKEVTKQLELDV